MKGIITVNNQDTEITTPVTESSEISIFNYVNKSNLMLASIREPLSVNSYKLLDLYLSMLEKTKSENGALVIRKKDFENILGVKRTRTEDLKKWCDEIFDLKISVGINPDKNSDLPVHMFSYFGTIIDEDSGQSVIVAKYNQDAKSLFFDSGAINSIKYQLKVTVSLNSESSIRLYIYLRSNLFFYKNGDFRRKWEIPFDELRKEMCCGKAYKDNFKEFNRRVLLKAQAEINEKTDIAFEYEFNRKNQTVGFTIAEYDKTIFLEEAGCSPEPKVKLSDEEAVKFKARKKIETQIDFDGLVASGYPPKTLEQIIKIMSEAKIKADKAPEKKTRIQGDYLPVTEVADVFNALTKEHIAFVIRRFLEAKERSEIKNAKSYLTTMLYNADEFTVLNESCNIEEEKRSDKSYDISKIQMLDYIDSI